MICMTYPTGDGQSYLTNELAEALIAAGHEVEALVLDWCAHPGDDGEVTWRRGVRIVRCAPEELSSLGETVRRASKFVLGGRRLARLAASRLDLKRFDAVIAWAPAAAIAPVLPLVRRAGVQHRLLFIWDFFPDHHREIGRIPGGPPYWIARAWEQRLLTHFTAIICTLPGNAAYLRRNYRLLPDQRVLVTPIWSETSPLEPADRNQVRRRHGLPLDTAIAVFGGQLVEGRGFEQLLAAADAAEAAGSDLRFLFIGQGRLAPMIRARAESARNVLYHPPISRREYLQLIGACDVGLVATVPGVSSFSFPSKTVDYLRAGLPVVAAVEGGNDFISILQDYGVGRGVPFGDPAALAFEADRLATEATCAAQARSNTRRCLEEVFDVRHAVATVARAVEPGSLTRPAPARSEALPSATESRC
jgi:glycosyltransferase involved in cell wall biosynthesis